MGDARAQSYACSVVRTYFTRRCLAIHATLIVLLAAFVLLTRWQVARATSGNTLSWAYAFEWPLFAGYAIYMWWQLIHDGPRSRQQPGSRAAPEESTAGPSDGDQSDAPVGWALGTPRRRQAAMAGAQPVEKSARVETPSSDDEDQELAAYNRYLAQLHASGGRKSW